MASCVHSWIAGRLSGSPGRRMLSHLEYRPARSGGSQPRHAEPWGAYQAGSSSGLARNHECSGARHGDGLGYLAVSIDDPESDAIYRPASSRCLSRFVFSGISLAA
jgi:hypothetical protein